MKRILIAFLLSGLLAFPAQSQTKKQIKDWYCQYNTMFFQDKLPKNVVISRTTDPNIYADTRKVGNRFIITFSNSYKLGEILTELLLLHEMCHIDTWDEAEKGTDHGSQWKVCMFKLKYMGAFDHLLIEAY